ncbi:triose-phosphate isomerase [Sphingomonas abietis]|uniref:Triosephosphate isomerase n=1 Tax=Sphingomonas abietis TaxID=3012344 RepID=A0ABY7NR56_9SPHN|nr:triose-phosphate isomerase [Sphingomonas abietis]WBO23672.1 triose-phosphate isomerase [Sphingomonas abietis]
MRRRLIAGNWKMNGSRESLAELDGIAAAAAQAEGVDVAICPPFTLIERATARVPALPIGAQDCHAVDKGAHTGCVSAGMLVEAGAQIVIVGHSERRAAQHESDAAVKAKAEGAIAAGLTVIVCIGETEAQRDAGEAQIVVTGQMRGSLPVAGGDRLIVAYEPVWAIGTGLIPSLADVGAMHRVIRGVLIELLGAERAATVRILYGGSMTGDNAADLLAIPDVDGGLVGGASLKAATFVPIIAAAAA